MKRVIRASILDRFASGSGSAVGSGIREGRFKFGSGKKFELSNGIMFHPASAQVNIDANTGEIHVYCNVFLKLEGTEGSVAKEFFALTPEEVTYIYDEFSKMTYEEAWNTLYDTNPSRFSKYGLTRF